MRKELIALILAGTSLAASRRADAQVEVVRAAVNLAQADQAPCMKRECLNWNKALRSPTGVFNVTRCGTSPRQQIELALAFRMMARETSNPAWNELAIAAVASAFIHHPASYSLIQQSQGETIVELDRRLNKGEHMDTLRPGGAKDYLAKAGKWFDAPQCLP